MTPPTIIPDHLARLMNPADRRALGVHTPEERDARADSLREVDLQRLCEQALSSRGIVYLHLSPRAREKAGWPDLVFCLSGRPFAVELKTPAGRLSPDQERLLARLAADGWNTRIVRSFDAFLAILEAQHA